MSLPLVSVRIPCLWATFFLALPTVSIYAQTVNEEVLPKSDQMKPWFNNVKVGEFAEYGKPGRTAREYTMRRVVTAVTKDAVVETMTITEGAMKEGGLDSRMSVVIRYTFTGEDRKQEKGVTTKTAKEKVKVENKEIECKVVETYKDDKLFSKIWYSDMVPLSGEVKTFYAKDKVELQLIRYGRRKSGK